MKIGIYEILQDKFAIIIWLVQKLIQLALFCQSFLSRIMVNFITACLEHAICDIIPKHDNYIAAQNASSEEVFYCYQHHYDDE